MANELSTLWQFMRGELPVAAFEQWVYTTPELDAHLGADLYEQVISADYRSDEGVERPRLLLAMGLEGVPHPMTHEQLEATLNRLFRDLLAENRSYFGAGGPDYYGVRAENVSEDGSELDLVLTFKAGVRYCCFESGCHFGYYMEEVWSRLREMMRLHGLGHVPPLTVRTLRGVVERGAIADTGSALHGDPRPRP